MQSNSLGNCPKGLVAEIIFDLRVRIVKPGTLRGSNKNSWKFGNVKQIFFTVRCEVSYPLPSNEVVPSNLNKNTIPLHLHNVPFFCCESQHSPMCLHDFNLTI